MKGGTLGALAIDVESRDEKKIVERHYKNPKV